MTTFDLLLQQTINGLSLGAMYALLALGFTLVYGILELINFSHFNVFMVGSFIAMFVLQTFGLSGQEVMLTGLPLVGVLLVAFVVTMVFCGGLGVTIERLSLRPLRNVKGPAAMITTIGVSYVLFNIDPADGRRGFEELPEPDALGAFADRRRGAGPARHPDLGDRAAADGGALHVRAAVPHRQGDARHRAGPRSRAHDGRRGRSGHRHGLLPRARRWPARAA